jgi:hypothetical protein
MRPRQYTEANAPGQLFPHFWEDKSLKSIRLGHAFHGYRETASLIDLKE